MWMTNIPNALTLCRISIIPVFVVAFYYPGHWQYQIATFIFALAAITDWLDGYLARKLRQVSPVGAFLDPVADKLIVVVALVLLVEAYRSMLLTIPTIIIICREITVSALREWMAALGYRDKVSVSWLGKLKTVTQMLAILLLLSQPRILGNTVTWSGYAALWVATLLAAGSMYQYFYIAAKQIKAANKANKKVRRAGVSRRAR